MKYESLSLQILGIPFSKQSAKFTKKGFAYTPAKVKNAEKSVRFQVISQLPPAFEIWDEPIAITKCHFIFPPLKTFSKKKQDALKSGEVIFKDTKPDLTDNLFKGLMDAMEGVVFVNDSRIVMQDNVKKFYGLIPGIHIDMQILQRLEPK